LASTHYSNLVKQRLAQENIPFISGQDNPANIPQAKPIETVWVLLAQKVYPND
jgi:hypothetical protein